MATNRGRRGVNGKMGRENGASGRTLVRTCRSGRASRSHVCCKSLAPADGAFSSTFGRLREDRSLAHALFELAAIADEASAGVGLPRSPSGASKYGKFYRRARTQLLPNEGGST